MSVGDDHAQPGIAQTDEQRDVLGSGGETGGKPEPKTADDWAARGAPRGGSGRPPVALGGSSAGQSDRVPASGGSRPADLESKDKPTD